MPRQTSFRFTAAADPAVEAACARHAGAARFAYNECLQAVRDALQARRSDPSVAVPWSGFSLVNHFNAWKRSDAGGRTWAVDSAGQVELAGVGLSWRDQVSAQVFEEAAVDLGRALAAYAESRAGRRKGARVGFPRFKRKGRVRESFRLRNKLAKTSKASIRVGVPNGPRVVVLPTIGPVRVVEDTRRLRRLLRPGSDGVARARIWYASVARHRGRWVISLSVQAPDLHPGLRHRPRERGDHGGFVGIDRGLAAHLVAATADGQEVGRVSPPQSLVRALPKLRRASRAANRKQPGSVNRARATQRLSRLHGRVAGQRHHHAHVLSTRLVKTHDRLCVEDLAISNLVRNRHLARSIADAGWGQLHRLLDYKARWYGAELMVAPRFFPSSKTCSACGRRKGRLVLSERMFRCPAEEDGCGLVLDRDRNAAVNLAAWAEAEHARRVQAPDLQAAGWVTNACGGIGAGHRTRGGETDPQPHLTRGGGSRNRTGPSAGGLARTPEQGAED